MSRVPAHRPSVLIAHGDAAWRDQARSRLERLGYEVAECPEPSWAADLLTGSRPFDLVAVSSEIDPSSQARILRAIKKRRAAPKLMILLDQLDSSTLAYRSQSGLLTHRVGPDPEPFVRAVAEAVGPAPRPQ